MHEFADQVLTHLRAIWRYRWYGVLVAWIVALAGWSVVYRMPDRYEANARVFVDTQSMLRPLLTGLAVQPNLDQIVTMMSHTLVNRPNLERVIQMTGLDAAHQGAADREQLIANLNTNLAIKGGGRENLYTITYVDRDRELAMRVVQSLLKIFVEGSLGDKRKDSDTARQFIEQQIQLYSEKLASVDNAITAFKRRNQGLMPGEGRDYYGRLSDARVALRQATLDLNEALKSRDALKRQLAGDAEVATKQSDKGNAAATYSELDVRIHALEQKLDGLRLAYTEQHPDIVALVHVITQLKEQKAAEQEGKKPGPQLPQGPVYEQLTVALAAGEARVAAMKARAEEYAIRYNELQAAAHALPQIEAEYKQLTRDYEVTKARYDKLLERRESAQITGDVEASDAAMGFRIIDPPQVPLAPSAPNRRLLMSLVLLAALGGGLGFAFLVSQIRTTFNSERALREASGLRVLGTIAFSLTGEQRRRRTRGLFALVLSVLSLLSAYIAIMASLMLTASRV